jgi:hypothetical protein
MTEILVKLVNMFIRLMNREGRDAKPQSRRRDPHEISR